MIRRNFKGNSALSKKVKPRKKKESDISWEKKSKKIWKEYDERKKKELEKNKKKSKIKKVKAKTKKKIKTNQKKKITSQKKNNQSIKSNRNNRILKGISKKSPMILEQLRLIEIKKELVEYGYEESKITNKNASNLLNAIKDLKKIGITSLPKDFEEAKYWIVCKKLKNIGFPITPNTTKEGEECIEYMIIHSQLKKYGYEEVPKSVKDAKAALKKLEVDRQKEALKEIERLNKNRKKTFSKSRDFTTF